VYGPDGIFCTADDPVGEGLIAVDGTLPAVTGTATAVVHNTGDVGVDLGPVITDGAEFSCPALTQQGDAGGAGIVGAFTIVHVEQVGDLAITAQLFTQHTATSGCVGDCDSGGTVTVDEILTMVNTALSNGDVSVCSAGDANQDGSITIDEILTAVNNALTGTCGG
jgi:hypothetical protein